MASALPEPISLDVKSADATSQKVPELNGHSELSDLKMESESAPLLNGNSKPDSHEPTNGVTEQKVSADPTDSSADAPSAADPVSKPDAEPTTTSPPLEDDAKPELVAKASSPEPAADVVMEDATNGGKVEAPAEEAANEAESTAPAPLSEVVKDVDMADAEKEGQANGTNESSVPPPVDETPAAPAPSAQEVDLHPASMSQLAIDSVEIEPVPTTAEASMTDVPEALPASTKIAREREEDVSDEPAAKRARTESQPGDAMEVDNTTEKPRGSSVSELPGWQTPESDAVALSDYQRREFRKVVTGAKKTKAGSGFRDSVEKLWPTVWESYAQLVENPTDLTEIDRRLRDANIGTLGDFKREVALLYQNSITFNGADHDVTKSAWSLVEQIWTKVRDVPLEEPPKTKQAPKTMPTRHAEPRAAAAQPPPPPPRRTSTAIASSPTEKAPPAETYAVPPSGVPQVRRASTQIDGDRPKRAIHPPKNKDLDYPSKPFNKNKLSPELRFCFELLEELTDSKHFNTNHPFLVPVDPVALGIPTYFNVIKKPMDLETMSTKLKKGEYSTAKDFEKDMQLIFKNCAKFNSPGTPVHVQGKQLESLFKAEWAKKDQWLAKNAQGKASSVGASSSHSDPESEAEEEEPPAPTPEDTALASAVASLSKRLEEETMKLNKMFMEDEPIPTMITVQRTVVETIQQSLLTEKAKLAATQKQDKPAKPKAAKAAKPKPAAGASKKAAAGAATKKAAGGAGGAGGGAGKKAAAKRTLTSTEKDLIASAINDLESPNIEKAIDLIKRDTGQAENDSGELELDIDQLSNDCLLSLWALCKKAIPGFGKDQAGPASSPAVTKQASKSSKPKKNKPMSAREQEERIAELNRLRELYKDGKTGQEAAPTALPTAEAQGGDSSEDSDSEEE